MKKLLSLLALVLCFACGMRGEESHDYAVKTTKAPVWIYQDATSTVAGYLDYGARPESEVDENDPQWIHVKSGNLEGWSHILAFCHRASDPEDLDLANGALADFLRDAGVQQDVIDACTSGTPSSGQLKAFNDVAQEPTVDNSGDGFIEPYSARGLEPMFIYVITEDVECPVNEAYAYHGNAIRLEKTSETFEKGMVFATEDTQPDGMVLMSEGKGFDVPASAYHLLTEDEYTAYMNRQLDLKSHYLGTTLRYYLETHDVAQAADWNVDFKQYTRTGLADLWPMLVPLLPLLLIFIMGMRKNANPTVWAYAAIADLLVLCVICWRYVSMPSAQFNDLGGLAWVPIAIVALLAMALILFVAWRLGLAALAKYDVSFSIKSAAVGFGIGVALCIVLDLVLILLMGLDKSSVTVGVVNIICLLGGTLGWAVVALLRQNPAAAAALPAVIILWAVAITLGLVLLAIVFFVAFFIVVWMFMSGNLGGGKNIIPGLVGSEQATCSKCRHFGSVHCPRSRPSGSDSACSSFEA